ncbi:hypothetical protein SAMN05660830_00975 [Halodesulfovibrio aestuarii]|uniref:Uncharacterized protein n=1 Tax=Halodesulfovibrio aestuarii TaxID=126333 RepID=A0A8G2C899_9BACT|nr:hypothetical protein SAMN05660830_00975 [Halodesulfovibrio aestuarii]
MSGKFYLQTLQEADCEAILSQRFGVLGGYIAFEHQPYSFFSCQNCDGFSESVIIADE